MNKENALILDPTCGGKMFYFDKNDSRILFADIRKLETELCDGRKFEVSPDIQMDFTKMPFEDARFKMVVFDPPHLTRNTGGNKSKFNTMYGALHSNWREMLSQGLSECFRVLKSGGILIFKWSETDIKVSEILKLTPEKPILGNKSGKASKTHWLVFMKD